MKSGSIFYLLAGPVLLATIGLTGCSNTAVVPNPKMTTSVAIKPDQKAATAPIEPISKTGDDNGRAILAQIKACGSKTDNDSIAFLNDRLKSPILEFQLASIEALGNNPSPLATDSLCQCFNTAGSPLIEEAVKTAMLKSSDRSKIYSMMVTVKSRQDEELQRQQAEAEKVRKKDLDAAIAKWKADPAVAPVPVEIAREAREAWTRQLGAEDDKEMADHHFDRAQAARNARDRLLIMSDSEMCEEVHRVYLANQKIALQQEQEREQARQSEQLAQAQADQSKQARAHEQQVSAAQNEFGWHVAEKVADVGLTILGKIAEKWVEDGCPNPF